MNITISIGMIEIIEIMDVEKLEVAFQIRRKVFVVEQKVTEEEEFDGLDQISRQFLALYQKKPAGTARMRLTPEGVKLERFSILIEYRKKRIGSELVKFLLSQAKILESKKVYLHAQKEVENFYKQLGFFPVGETFLEANILHIKMEFSK